jgi:diguanylate cyclase (GGDEF)-like protein
MNEKAINVLLIEDNPGDARLIQELLAEPGGAVFTLECVDRLSTGLKRLVEGGIDVILLDLGLPDSQGLDTIVKAYDQVQDVPIVVLTGFDDEALAIQAMRAGAQDYLAKGQMDGNLLIRTVRYAIERELAEEALRKAYSELERRVNERTAELAKANEELRNEIAERKRAEKALKESQEKYKSLYEKTKDMAQKDPLTGVFNHGQINELLEHEIERSKRGSHVFSVMMLDVDDMKLINDTYGHVVGDGLLKDVAAILRDTPRSVDSVGRYGGDEFLMILPYTDGQKAKVLAQRIAERIKQEKFKIDEKTKIPVRLSIGIATYPFDSAVAQGLISLADTGMYKSKRSGQDVVTASVPEVIEYLSVKNPSLTILEGLVAAVNSKDRYTKAHSDMVTSYAVSLAKEAGLSNEQIEVLRIASLLHDVGKIGIPDTILRKPGPLDSEEFEIVKQHPKLGAMMLDGTGQHQEDVRGPIMYHHERYDGKGYPARLKGEDIPLLARIITAADAYSAMITDRPYRKALTKGEAVAELKRHAGTQFDPDLVSKFIKCLKQSDPREGFDKENRGDEGLLLH